MRLNPFKGPAPDQAVSTLPLKDSTPTTCQDRSSGKTAAPVEKKAPKSSRRFNFFPPNLIKSKLHLHTFFKVSWYVVTVTQPEKF